RLRAGGDPTRPQRKEEVLHVHPDIERHADVEALLHTDDGHVGRVEELVVSEDPPHPPLLIIARDPHLFVELDCALDLEPAIIALETKDAQPLAAPRDRLLRRLHKTPRELIAHSS